MLPKDLRTRRLVLGVSLEELARLAAVDLPLLAAMENGDAAISPAVIGALANVERERGPVNSTNPPS